jgi:hypothetical protein
MRHKFAPILVDDVADRVLYLMNRAPMRHKFAPILVDDVAGRALYLMNGAPMRHKFAPILVDDVAGRALHLGQPYLLLVLQQLRSGCKCGAALATLPVPSRGRQRILRKTHQC